MSAPTSEELVARVEKVRAKAQAQVTRWAAEGRCTACGSDDDVRGMRCAACRAKASLPAQPPARADL